MCYDKDQVRGSLYELAARLLRAQLQGMACHVFALLRITRHYVSLMRYECPLRYEIGLTARLGNLIETRRLSEKLRREKQWGAALDGCLFLGIRELSRETAALALLDDERWYAAALRLACGDRARGIRLLPRDGIWTDASLAIRDGDMRAVLALLEEGGTPAAVRLTLGMAAHGMMD